MTLALLIGLIVLAAVLRDTRRRLTGLERELSEYAARFRWQGGPEAATPSTPAPNLEDQNERLVEGPDFQFEETMLSSAEN